MHKKRFFALVVFLLLLPVLAWADKLEVRRPANVYAEPNRQSEVLARLDPSEKEGPYLINLLDSEKVNGYYHVRVPWKVKEGWVYKTYVRRYQGQHPSYQAYKRTMYKHWIDEDGDCQNTRNEVLIRDSIEPVKYKTSNECVVVSGTWKDPYTGTVFHDPKQLDVDHMVPLKNAHESGGWAWDSENKKSYANYLANSWHLIAVSASENRKKGDKGPDKYLSPQVEYHCTYVKNWVKIKEEWGLEMTESEGMAVQKILAGCN